MTINQPGLLTSEVTNYHSLAENLCLVVPGEQMNDIDLVRFSKSLGDRNGLIGADGVVFIVEIGGQITRSRCFRANGAEVNLSLSGLGCAGRHLGQSTKASLAGVVTTLGTFCVEAPPSPFSDLKCYKTVVPNISTALESPCLVSKTAQVWDAPVAESESCRMFAVEPGEPHFVTFPAGTRSSAMPAAAFVLLTDERFGRLKTNWVSTQLRADTSLEA